MRKTGMILVMVLTAAVILTAAGEGMIPITLSTEGVQTENEGIRIDGQTVTITQPGEYLVDGTLDNGQILVDCQENGKVTLYLNGVSIHNETGPALLIGNCSPRAVVSLVEGKQNRLSNGKNLIFEEGDEPDGVIFTRSDLTLCGTGSLEIEAGAMNGISSKDDLRIEGGSLTVDVPNHGLKGKDCVEISGGEVTIRAGRDGIKSTNKKDPSLGYIEITGGDIRISCGDEAISFISYCNISGGKMSMTIDQQ